MQGMNRYLPRTIEPALKKFAKFFKVVLVIGPRQCGKSTLLAKTFPGYRHFVFDPVLDLYDTRRDPDLFLDNFPAPLILDEVQHVPELLPAIKRRVDRLEGSGLYLLTGSQNLSILRSVAESMAGRVGILELGPMTLKELEGKGLEGDSPFDSWLASNGSGLPDLSGVREDKTASSLKTEGIARILWRGTMPGLVDAPNDLVPAWHDSYLTTYVERDIRSAASMRDLGDFGRFLRLAAALDGQEINFSQLGRELGLRPDVARRWLDLLALSFQWHELPPWHGNAIKRLSGRPKGHFADSGMACRLLGIGSPEALAANPKIGSLFESFVVNLLRRKMLASGTRPDLFHWRSSGGAEVDLVIRSDDKLLPVEVKYKSMPDGQDTRGMAAFRDTYAGLCSATGIIVHAGSESMRLNATTLALSVWDI